MWTVVHREQHVASPYTGVPDAKRAASSAPICRSGGTPEELFDSAAAMMSGKELQRNTATGPNTGTQPSDRPEGAGSAALTRGAGHELESS